MNNIRNFCIIAHVDHGKSTLADRLLEVTETIDKRQMKEQFLDSLELERERGITVKMAPVRMVYHSQTLNPKFEILNKSQKSNSKSLEIRNPKLEIANSEQEFVLNLIDTPGHSDFSYEVSRALAAVEGAVLLVDGLQGVQAQTLATLREAKRLGLDLIGAVNKVDLFQGGEEELENAINDLAELLEVDPSEVLQVSGKTGQGVPELLDAVVQKISPPEESEQDYFRALIFDSFYDNHKGVVAGVRIFDNSIKDGDNAHLMFSDQSFRVKELGVFAPNLKKSDTLSFGEIGYIATGIKDPEKIKIGDTVTRESEKSEVSPLPGYKEPKPAVFVSFYPEDSDEYKELGQSFQKLKLNDSSLDIEHDKNEILGKGYRVGFLGRLHYEITLERIEGEFGITTINTFPSVVYKAKIGGEWREITSPEEVMGKEVQEMQEPMIDMEVILPSRYLSDFMAVQYTFRMKNVEVNDSESGGRNVVISCLMPLSELISGFDDVLKSITSGYGSFSYQRAGYELADVVGVDILVSKGRVPGLSRFFPKDVYEVEARKMVKKLKELLPKIQYAQPIQAIVGSKVIAREDVPALKKNVTGHLYGGDRTRKIKLWKKQKKGKEKLKRLGGAEIDSKVFKELLKK